MNGSDDIEIQRQFRLKPKEVVLTDPPAAPGDEKSISVQKIHAENWHAAQVGKKENLRKNETDSENGEEGFKRTPGSTDGPIRVQTFLDENASVLQKAGANELSFKPPVRSRRRRDFFALMSFALACAILFVMTMGANIQAIFLALVGFSFTVASLAWVMFGIVDRY